MGSEKYNPYNYQRYFNLPKPAPNYEPSRTLSAPDIAGLLNVRTQAEIDRIRREAEEVMHRQWYTDSFGFGHSSRERALDANASNEQVLGRRPCQADDR